MSDERLQILEMVRDGKVTADEGLRLLEALAKTETVEEPVKPKRVPSNRMLHIEVDGDEEVNITIPLGLVESFAKISRFMPKRAAAKLEENGIDLSEIDLEAMVAALEAGASNVDLVNVEASDGTEVRIFIE